MRTRRLLLLHTTSHGRVRLHGGAAPRGLRTGQQLNVTGVWRRHTHRSLRRSLRASLGGAATAGATAVQGSTEPYPHYLLPLRVSMQPGKAPTPELKGESGGRRRGRTLALRRLHCSTAAVTRSRISSATVPPLPLPPPAPPAAAPAGTAGGAGGAAVLSSNKLVAAQLPTLFIPSEHQPCLQ